MTKRDEQGMEEDDFNPKSPTENANKDNFNSHSSPTRNEDHLKLTPCAAEEDAFKSLENSESYDTNAASKLYNYSNWETILSQYETYTKKLSKSIERNYGTDNEIPLMLKATPAAEPPIYLEKAKAELIDLNSNDLVCTQNKPIPLITVRQHVKVNFNLDRVPLPCEQCKAAKCICKDLHRVRTHLLD